MHKPSAFFLNALLALFTIPSALAVTVFTTNPAGQSAYETAPPNGTGFSYTGTVNSSSGVYLGNYSGSYYVLTADHVGSPLNSGSFTFTLGSTPSNQIQYNVVAGSYRQVQSGLDLGVFAITSSNTTQLDALTNLVLGTPMLTTATNLNLIGYGGGTKRGGFNTPESDQNGELYENVSYDGYNEVVFTTDFDSLEGQAQAIPNDSGGGVFNLGPGGLELTGIMVAVDNLANPTITYSVDVNTYRTQILQAVPEPASGLLVVSGLLFLGFTSVRRLLQRRPGL